MIRQRLELLFNICIITAPLVLILLPVDFFDNGTVVCLSKRLAGMECYACGLTRGVMHLIHLDIEGAWTFNKLTFLVMPFLVLIWVRAVLIISGRPLPRWLDKLT